MNIDTIQPTREEIIEAVQSLGNTPDEIAHRLEDLGIQGVPCNSWVCPLAVFLSNRFPDHSVRVTCSDIKVGDVLVKCFPDMPQVAQFIAFVDDRLYPELSSRHCGKCSASLTQDDIDAMLDPEDALNQAQEIPSCPHCPPPD